MERRSVRRHARRKRRAGLLFVTVAPALAVIVAVAVLFPLLVSPGQGEDAPPATASAATTPTTPASATAPVSTVSASGSVVLVIEHDGEAAVITLIAAAPEGGLVLGLPAISLLRTGDRFDRLARIYSADDPDVLGAAVADAFRVPVAAVAAVSWAELRRDLQNAGFGRLPPGQPDRDPTVAARLAEAVAAACKAAAVSAGPNVWAGLPLTGDPDGFRAALGGVLVQTGAAVWTGQAVSGTIVEQGDLTYLEPDVGAIRGLLAGTGAGG
jgi:hypothetical protein